MKITVDIDCTPAEARQFMGLPDLEPLQKAAMAEIEKRMMAEIERFSPEGLLKTWLSMAPINSDWLQDLMRQGEVKFRSSYISCVGVSSLVASPLLQASDLTRA